MTKEQLSQAIAEKLGWPYKIHLPGLDGGFSRYFDPFTSEIDSARLRRAAMPACGLEFHPTRNQWRCVPHCQLASTPVIYHADDKTAIVLAAKAWLNIEGELE